MTTDWKSVPVPKSYADLYRDYGDPREASFAKQYLVETQHEIAGGKQVSITCHVAIADRLHDVFAALVAAGKVDLIKSYNGCYVVRSVRGMSSPSLHSWGLAIDVNASDFPLGSTKAQDPELIKAFKDAGFFWGGDFKKRKDPMHFQLSDV